MNSLNASKPVEWRSARECGSDCVLNDSQFDSAVDEFDGLNVPASGFSNDWLLVIPCITAGGPLPGICSLRPACCDDHCSRFVAAEPGAAALALGRRLLPRRESYSG